jgi:hypothetical protein
MRTLLILMMLFSVEIVHAEDTSSDTTISPHLTYRAVGLERRKGAIHARSFHKDSFEQIYGSIRFHRQIDYVHDVVIEPSFRQVRHRPELLQFLFEEAYIDTLLGADTWLTVGKKNEFTGSGYFVQPSNLMHEYRDLFDSLYQKEGVDIIRMQWRGESSSLGLAHLPKRAADYSRGSLLMVGNLEILDTEANLQTKYDLFRQDYVVGMSVARFFGERIELHFDGQYRAFQNDADEELQVTDFEKEKDSDVTVNGGHYKWRSYSSYCADNPDTNDGKCGDENSGYYVTGTRLVVTARRTLVVEGVVQQNGLSKQEFENMYGDIRGTTKHPTPRFLIGRNYAAFSYSDDDTIDKLHLGMSYMQNVDDGSGFGNVSIKKTLSKATSIEFLPTFFRGEKNTEFGEMPFVTAYNLLIRGRF